MNPIRYGNSKVNHEGVRPPKGSDVFVVALCGAKGTDFLRPMNKVTCKKCLAILEKQGRVEE